MLNREKVLTDYTDVHRLISVKIPVCRQAGVTTLRNTQMLHSEQNDERIATQLKSNQGSIAGNHKQKT